MRIEGSPQNISWEQLARIPTVEDLIFVLRAKEVDLTYNHFLTVAIPRDSINVLTQPRKTFDDIDTLGENIGEVGQINPITFALFDEEQCLAYLETINDIWKTNHQFKDLAPVVTNGHRHYIFLVAGERRFRGLSHLMIEGCEACHKKYGPGTCFERHFPPQLFPNNSVEGRLRPRISTEEAIELQFAENTHKAVIAHEEARAYYNYLRHKRRLDPNYPLSLFARKVGRRPETIRKAIQFCELPLSIQEYVEKSYFSYGIACELARLRNETGMSEEDLKWWANRVIANNYKKEEFSQLVKKYIYNTKSEQSMLQFFTTEQEKAMKRAYFKQVVAREMVKGVWYWITYFQRVKGLLQDGQMGKKDSPFSEGSPVRIFRKLVHELQASQPHLKGLLPKREYQFAEEALQATSGIFALLEDTLPKEPYKKENLIYAEQAPV